MKTHTIKTPTAELLVLELPETGSTFDVLTALNSETEGYTLLGKPDKISEERTVKESLLSLLESEIYWDVNPLANEIHAPDIEEWHEAEQKTFDRNRSLIFKKNK